MEVEILAKIMKSIESYIQEEGDMRRTRYVDIAIALS